MVLPGGGAGLWIVCPGHRACADATPPALGSQSGYRLHHGLLFRIVMRISTAICHGWRWRSPPFAIALAAGVGVGTMVESMRGGVTGGNSLLNAPVVAHRTFRVMRHYLT